MSRPIEDYGLIGDGESAALVSRDGSIDWLCWPRFDDDACFAALLGDERHGHWSIAPQSHVQRKTRRYRPDTLIIETDFEDGENAARIIDFMPMRTEHPSLVRIVCGLRGTMHLRSTMRLRFGYGAVPPWLSVQDDAIVARVGPDLIVVRAPVRHDLHDDVIDACFDIEATDRMAFVMSYGPSHLPAPAPLDAEAALAATTRFWREWIGRFDDTKTDWPQQTRRSLITLKALFHAKTGGLVAAPTTSLPEVRGGEMNWDYRYCWLRDASFALGALLNAGFHDEARSWRDWLLRALAGSPEHIRTVYRADGARYLREWTVDFLPGYQDSTPVRVGNEASVQQQMDVLGEVIDCLDFAARGGIDPDEQEEVVRLRIVEHLEKSWKLPGAGIWETRGEARHYTYSKVMAWVAVDRCLACDSRRARADREVRLTALREHIREEVLHKGYDVRLNSFVQYYGAQTVDASLLLLPLVGFISATAPEMAGTIARIETELSEGGLIRRTQASEDGRAEGSLLACACWLADCMQLQGRHADARAQFERVLQTANDLGLLAEEFDVNEGRLSGNFPQALTHLAVVNTALSLCGPVLARGGR